LELDFGIACVSVHLLHFGYVALDLNDASHSPRMLEENSRLSEAKGVYEM
jgi:hypothetical protein